MIINRGIPITATVKTPTIQIKKTPSLQAPQPRSPAQEQLEIRANNSYTGSDPFVQQLRTIAERTPQRNQSFESLRSENNRVRTGIESHSQALLKEKEFDQIFERTQDPNAIRNAPRSALELPPNEMLFYGREEEQVNDIQIADEDFVPYSDYAPIPIVPPVEIGFYKYESIIENLDSRERLLSREPETIIPPPMREPFPQPVDDDFSKMPPPMAERLKPPIPEHLTYPDTQRDFTGRIYVRPDTEGTQTVQPSAQQTVRTFDDETKLHSEITRKPLPNHEANKISIKASDEPPPQEPPTQKTINTAIARDVPVVDTPPPNRALDTYEQFERQLNGTAQLFQEDQQILSRTL